MIRRTGFLNDFLRVSFMRRILGGRSQGVKSLFCLPVFSAWVFALFVILASGCQSAETAHTADLSDETPTPIRFDARPVPTLLPRTNLYLFSLPTGLFIIVKESIFNTGINIGLLRMI